MNETYGVRIGFAQWMLVGVPLVVVGLPITHLVLTRLLYPVGSRELEGGRQLFAEQLRALGPMSRAERRVLAVAAGVALLWVGQPLLAGWLPGLTDAGIAVLGATVLFVIPVDARRGQFLLDWKTAERLPWGTLLLFGGGLSLAAAVSRTGLAEWIGGGLGAARLWPVVLLILLTTAVIVLLTELTSNTATAAAFLPIVGSVAVGVGQSPLLLAVPAVLAASCAFMLPVATPPNAIVYGSGALTVPQMARAGLVLNLAFTLLITLLAYTVVIAVFGVELGSVPAWALPG
jgi:solute carrier family 13 (sodium-dependent dicarboxylate transporter), member 2/3/5